MAYGTKEKSLQSLSELIFQPMNVKYLYSSSESTNFKELKYLKELKNLGGVATVLLGLFSFFTSFQTDWMIIRSDIGVEHGLLQLMAK